jgi:hypothetical protein
MIQHIMINQRRCDINILAQPDPYLTVSQITLYTTPFSKWMQKDVCVRTNIANMIAASLLHWFTT